MINDIDDIENQLLQPILNVNNPTELTTEEKAYNAEVLALSCPVSQQIFLDPVRLIFDNGQKSPHAFEQEIVRRLEQKRCPMTRGIVIGYIDDIEMKQKVTTFLAENESARPLQYQNNTWLITETANSAMTGQNDHLFSRELTLKLILKFAFGGMLMGGVYAGGFTAAASALGSTILQDHHQEIDRQADTAYIGGALLGAASYYLTMTYKFFYVPHPWTNKELAALLTTYLLAMLASIPLGALIVPFEEHNSIGLMVAKQLLGMAILAISVGGIIRLNMNAEDNESNTRVITPRGYSRIPFLENYVEPTPVAAMGTVPSLTTPLLLANAPALAAELAFSPSNQSS